MVETYNHGMKLSIIYKNQGKNQGLALTLDSLSGYKTYSVGDDLFLDISNWPANYSLFDFSKQVKTRLYNSYARKEAFKKISEFDSDRLITDYPQPRHQYTKFNTYGALADLHHQKHRIFFAPPKQLESELEIFYNLLSKQKIKIQHIYANFIDIYKLQKILSVLKIGFFLNEYGLEKAGRLATEGAMEGLILSPLHFKNFVNAFLINNPYAFALPLSKTETHICFIPQQIMVHPHVASVGVPEMFMSSSYPFSGSHEHDPFISINLSSLRIMELCEVIHISIDKYFQSVFRLKKYADESGVVDGFVFLQHYTIACLILSDFTAASSANADYSKINFCFSCLDKIANIIAPENVQAEAIVWNNFFDESSLKKVESILKEQLSDQYKELIHQLVTKFYANYTFLDLKKQEISMRDFRNLRHGTFLKNDKFKKLFAAESDGKFSKGTIYFHTYMLVLAFILDNDNFIKSFKN